MDLSNWKDAARARLRPLVLTLDSWGFSPLTVTILGTVIALLGAWMVAEGLLFLGTVVFLLGSALDMLDGALARLQGTVSRRGAFLDSVLDRFGEAGYLTGVAIWFMSEMPDSWLRAVILVLVVFFGSLATSYVRARAEGLGETCNVGLLQRTERVILLGVGGLLGHIVLQGVLWALAIMTLVTTFQRIVHVAAKLPGPPPPAERTPEPQPEPQPEARPETTEPRPETTEPPTATGPAAGAATTGAATGQPVAPPPPAADDLGAGGEVPGTDRDAGDGRTPEAEDGDWRRGDEIDPEERP